MFFFFMFLFSVLSLLLLLLLLSLFFNFAMETFSCWIYCTDFGYSKFKLANKPFYFQVIYLFNLTNHFHFEIVANENE